jgi:hypothetical protein
MRPVSDRIAAKARALAEKVYTRDHKHALQAIRRALWLERADVFEKAAARARNPHDGSDNLVSLWLLEAARCHTEAARCRKEARRGK